MNFRKFAVTAVMLPAFLFSGIGTSLAVFPGQNESPFPYKPRVDAPNYYGSPRHYAPSDRDIQRQRERERLDQMRWEHERRERERLDYERRERDRRELRELERERREYERRRYERDRYEEDRLEYERREKRRRDKEALDNFFRELFR